MLKKLTDCLGWIFCEFSFQWSGRIYIPDKKDWKWRHRLTIFIGERTYVTGCYFYGFWDKR